MTLSTIEDPVVLLEQRFWEIMGERDQLENRDGDDPKHPDVIEDERLHDIQLDIKEEIADTPTHSAAGVAVKLQQLQRDDKEFDGMGSWRPAAFRTALEALGRNTATIVEAPPAEDAAFFDALAEYDRLMAVSKSLERRKEVFRPGIPEAKEAEEAYDAAYDKASEAWTRTRETPTTTQAGLFAKLQAIIRFLANLQEDEIYEAEWDAIKDDMQRITGEAATG